MNKEEATQDVINIFKETFVELKDKKLDLKKNQSDFENWDSFSHMELVGKIEQKFGISLDLDEVIELDCPEKFIEVVLRKKLN